MKAIALIGFMGSGKSTVGKLLAKKLNFALVDIDAEIVKKAGKSIDNIFAEEGEAYFRQLEQEVLRYWASQENVILATGGGCIKEAANREIMARHCYRVYLACRPSVIAERVGNSKTVRPLLSNLAEGETLEQRIKTLLEPRLAYYQEHDLKVDTSDKSLMEVTAEIVKQVKKM